MERLLAKWDRPAPRSFLKGATSTVALTHSSILTYPLKDLAGDYVNPEGCDFTPHMADPVVDLEHRRHPLIKGRPVAWARASFDEPGAPYAVQMVRLNFADDGKPEDWHTVPVGTEFYKSSDRISMQTFALRESGVLPASSLEFAMLKGFYEPNGWSDLEGRESYRFDRVSVHRWTVCERGVNPGALLLEKSTAAATQVPALARILRDDRLNVGGRYERLHPLIRKALAPPGEAPAKKTTVRVGKAMTDYDDAPDDELETADMGAVDGMGGLDDGTGDNNEMPALGGVSAKYKFAQRIEEACDEYEHDMLSSDSPELRAMAEEIKAEARKLAAKVKLIGDKHDAKLNGHTDDEAPGKPGEDDDAAESADDEGEGKPGKGDDEEPDMEKDEEGTFKAVRGPYKSILKAVRRFSVADVKKAQEAARRQMQERQPAAAQPDPDELAALREELAGLKQDLIHLS